MTIPVLIEDQKFIALVHTGSNISVVSEVIQHTFKLQFDEPGINATSFGNIAQKTLGVVKVSLEIDGDKYIAPTQVVPKSSMNYDLLLGADFLNNLTLIVENGKVIIYQNSNDNEKLLARVNLTSSESKELNLDYIGDIKLREQLLGAIDSF